MSWLPCDPKGTVKPKPTLRLCWICPLVCHWSAVANDNDWFLNGRWEDGFSVCELLFWLILFRCQIFFCSFIAPRKIKWLSRVPAISDLLAQITPLWDLLPGTRLIIWAYIVLLWFPELDCDLFSTKFVPPIHSDKWRHSFFYEAKSNGSNFHRHFSDHFGRLWK